MAVGDLVSTDWMCEYNSLAFGGTSPYNIVAITGLASQPGVTTSDRERLRRHGLLPGDDFLVGRSILLEIEVHATSTTTFNDAMQNLLTALIPGNEEQPFVFQVPGLASGLKAQINCRPRKRDIPLDRSYYSSMGRAMIEFYATDPRIYLNLVQYDVTDMAVTGGGWNFNTTFDLDFGIAAMGGIIAAENMGTFSTPLVFRIDGPCVDPVIENSTTGHTLALSYTLNAGEYLLIDTETRSVMLNGTASRYSDLTSTSTWWDLPPGISNIVFRAATTDVAQLTITWRSAWV